MASQIQIVNLALTRVGSARIVSMNDGNKQARCMTALWDVTRQAELSKYLWGFALRRASLPKLASDPDWGFDFEYQLPSGYLRMVQVNDFFVSPSMADYRNSDDSPWAIEDSKIRTNFGDPLKVRYLVDVTDPGAFHPLFNQVLAAKLAYEACEELTNSNTKKSQLDADYTKAVRDAVRISAAERPPVGIADDSWILARL